MSDISPSDNLVMAADANPLGGLASALQGYLGSEIKNQQDIATKGQEAQIDADKEIKVAKAQHEIDNPPGGQQGVVYLTPDLAEKALPGWGKNIVETHNKQNPNAPLTLQQGYDALTKARELINPDTSKKDDKYEANQEKLQKEYADRRMKVLSNRSGGLGLQDAKVNMGVDLRNAINQFYDSKTDTYNIPPSMHEEIALGVAKMLSPTGVAPEGLVEKLKQSTAREKLANAAIYMGLADPESIGGPTQDVAKMFVDTIDRQGTIAEQLRNHYEDGIKTLADPNLEEKRRKQVSDADLTNSFTKELMKSPDYKKHQQAALDAHPAGKVSVVSPDGKRGFIPAGQLGDALKAGYKQAN